MNDARRHKDALINTLAEALVDVRQKRGLPFKQRALAAEQAQRGAPPRRGSLAG